MPTTNNTPNGKAPKAAKKAKKAPAKAAKKTPKKAANKTPAKAGPKKSKRGLSALDAAANVLGESKEPMNAKEMIEAMATKGYWKSPGGKTPHATLYSAILREIGKKGKDARFKKTERGKFTLAK